MTSRHLIGLVLILSVVAGCGSSGEVTTQDVKDYQNAGLKPGQANTSEADQQR